MARCRAIPTCQPETLSSPIRSVSVVAADWTIRAVILVAIGGALGCVLRYFAGVYLTRDAWPWGTIFVNLTGSLLIAILMFGAMGQGWFGPDARVFAGTGLLGGFTTMSSFAYETAAFVEDAELARALGYAGITIVGSLVMVFLGRMIAQSIPGA